MVILVVPVVPALLVKLQRIPKVQGPPLSPEYAVAPTGSKLQVATSGFVTAKVGSCRPLQAAAGVDTVTVNSCEVPLILDNEVLLGVMANVVVCTSTAVSCCTKVAPSQSNCVMVTVALPAATKLQEKDSSQVLSAALGANHPLVPGGGALQATMPAGLLITVGGGS
jgi:hypothetical protein